VLLGPVSDDLARSHARRVLGPEATVMTRVPIGFGNLNWRVRAESNDYILKIGPAESFAKWSAGEIGRRSAEAAGLPVPGLLDIDVTDEHVVRVYEWVDGVSPRSLDRAGQERFGEHLGSAIAQLHLEEFGSYSSRLDRSGLSFVNWGDYVTHRLAQIRARAEANRFPVSAVVDQVAGAVEAIIDQVSASARAVTCHRDLHADNLIVGPDGTLRAVIDWDMSEAWDQAGEWFKLEWMLFPDVPHARQTFIASYEAIHRDLEDWPNRVRLVNLIETLNTVANSDGHADPQFTARAVAHLDELRVTD